jgi:hypothetical protein
MGGVRRSAGRPAGARGRGPTYLGGHGVGLQLQKLCEDARHGSLGGGEAGSVVVVYAVTSVQTRNVWRPRGAQPIGRRQLPRAFSAASERGGAGRLPRARHSVSAVHRPRRPLSRRCTSYPGFLVSSPQCRPLPLLQLPYPRLAPASALVTATATAPASPQIQPRHGDPPALHTPVHAARDRACDEPPVRVYARPLQVLFEP